MPFRRSRRFSATPRRSWGFRKRGLKSGDTPPMRWEVAQFAFDAGLTPFSDADDTTNTFADVNVENIFLQVLSEQQFVGGGTHDLASSIQSLEIGGMVWTSHVGISNPVAGLRAAAHICEQVFLQRNDGIGSPVSLPNPFQNTPPIGGLFEDEQTAIPTRILSQRGQVIGIGEENTDADLMLRTFPTKSLRIRRRFGDFTGLYLGVSITHSQIFTPVTPPEWRYTTYGRIYYRTRF